MAGEEILGHGKILVEVQENVRRELAAAEAEFDRTMAKLDGKEAELRLKLETREFDRKIKEEEAKLAELRTKRADVKVGADTSKLDKAIASSETRLGRFKEQYAKINNDLSNIDADRAKAFERQQQKEGAARLKLARAEQAAAKATAREEEAAAKKEEQAAKKAEQAANKAQTGRSRVADEESKRRDRIHKAELDRETARFKQQLKEEAAQRAAAARQIDANERAIANKTRADTKSRLDLEKKATNDLLKTNKSLFDEMERGARMDEKHRASLAADKANATDLTRQYLDLKKRLDEVRSAKSKMFLGHQEKIRLDLDEKSLDAKLLALRARLAAVGEPPPEIHFDIKDDEGIKALGRWTDAISGASVRVGPFTSSIGGLVRALSFLGPVVTGIVGALGALASTIAMGIGGAIGIAAAGFAGLAPLIGAVALTTKGLLGQFKNAKAATDKLTKAQLQYGKGSKQAHAAQKQLNEVLKGMDPSARSAFRNFTKLRTEWHKAVDDVARKNIGHVMAQGVKTASDIMPMFAARTRTTFNILGKSITGWLQGIRSAKGRGVLDSLFTNANRALGPLLRGLGRLGGAIGKVLAGFSRYLPGIAKDFSSWAKGVNQAADSSGGMVTGMVNAFKSLVRFLGAAGKLLGALIGIGNGPGMSFIDSMTQGLNHMTDNINKNPDAVRKFFSDGVNTVKELWGILSSVVSIFVKWAEIMTPIAEQFLKIAEAITKVVNAIAGIGPMKSILSNAFQIFLAGALLSRILSIGGALRALITTGKELGALGIATKVFGGAFNVALGGLPNKVRSMKAANAELKTLGEASTVAGGERTAARTVAFTPIGGTGTTRTVVKDAAATEAAVAKTAGSVGRLERVGGAASGVLAGLGEATLGIANPIAGAALVIGGLGFAIAKLTGDSKGYTKELQHQTDLTHRFGVTAAALPVIFGGVAQSELQLRNAHTQTAQAQAEVNRLRKAGKTGTDEYKQAVLNLNQAKLGEFQSHQQLVDGLKQEQRYRNALTLTTDRNLQSAKKYAEGLGKRKFGTGTNLKDEFSTFTEAAKRQGMSLNDFLKAHKDEFGDTLIKRLTDYKKALDAITEAENKARRATELQTLGHVNQARALRGMVPLANEAARAFDQVRKLGGQHLSTTIGVKFQDPAQAQRVAETTTAALRSKVPKSVVSKIIADSKNADDAIRRLNNVRITPKKLRIIEEGGSAAVKMIERITGKKIGPKTAKIIERGGDDALHMLAKLLGVKLPTKLQRLKETGSDGILRTLAKILGIRIPPKVITLRRYDPNNIGAWLATIKSSIASIPSSKNVHISYSASTLPTPLPAKRHGKHGAAGGVYTAQDKMIERAYARASARQTKEQVKGGVYSRPTLLVGEENRSEYVIATNPAYRERNARYLQQAASEFGYKLVEPAAKGKHPKKRKKKSTAGKAIKREDKNAPGTKYSGGKKLNRPTKRRKALPVPEKYKAAAVPEDDIKTKADTAKTAYHKRQGEIKSADTQIHNLNNRYKDAPRGPHGARQRQSIMREMGRARNHKTELVRGIKGKSPSVEALRQQYVNLDREYKAVHNANAQIERLQTQINTEQSYMQADSTKYVATGDKTLVTDWRSHKTKREGLLTQLRELYKKAADLATDPDLKATLQGDFASTDSDLTDSIYNTPEPETDAESTAADDAKSKAADDLSRQQDEAKKYGVPVGQGDATEGALQQILSDIAVSGVNDVPDDPTTIYTDEHADSLKDNVEPASRLVSFWQGVLGRLQASGAAPEDIGAAAGELTSAQDSLRGLASDISAPPATTVQAQQVILSDARGNLYRDFGANQSTILRPGTAMGGPGVGAYGRNPNSGGANAGPGGGNVSNVTVNNTFPTPPPDPHTFSKGIEFELKASL